MSKLRCDTGKGAVMGGGGVAFILKTLFAAAVSECTTHHFQEPVAEWQGDEVSSYSQCDQKHLRALPAAGPVGPCSPSLPLTHSFKAPGLVFEPFFLKPHVSGFLLCAPEGLGNLADKEAFVSSILHSLFMQLGVISM